MKNVHNIHVEGGHMLMAWHLVWSDEENIAMERQNLQACIKSLPRCHRRQDSEFYKSLHAVGGDYSCQIRMSRDSV